MTSTTTRKRRLWGAAPLRWLAAMLRQRRTSAEILTRQKQIEALLQLEDWVLRDIGASRDELLQDREALRQRSRSKAGRR